MFVVLVLMAMAVTAVTAVVVTVAAVLVVLLAMIPAIVSYELVSIFRKDIISIISDEGLGVVSWH